MTSATALNGDHVSNPTTICVFCGSSPGSSPAHLAAARSLAHAFHAHQIKLVYGGGTVGLMGELARTLVSLSGPNAVHGVIPRALIKYEAVGSTVTPDMSNEEVSRKIMDQTVYGRTTVVDDMHSRKALMAREVTEGGFGGGFVALSGGYGTLEELMEVTTWNQLGIHARGVVIYNVDGYWDGLLKWVNDAVEAGFISRGNKEILAEASDAEGVVNALKDYQVSKDRFKLDWGSR